METIRISAIIIFMVMGFILLLKAYLPIIKSIKSKKMYQKSNTNSLIEYELNVLKTSQETEKKASAFVELMNLSYVLVHTLVNKGNNYDDNIQSKKFKKSLTPELLTRLNELEGKYE